MKHSPKQELPGSVSTAFPSQLWLLLSRLLLPRMQSHGTEFPKTSLNISFLKTSHESIHLYPVFCITISGNATKVKIPQVNSKTKIKFHLIQKYSWRWKFKASLFVPETRNFIKTLHQLRHYVIQNAIVKLKKSAHLRYSTSWKTLCILHEAEYHKCKYPIFYYLTQAGQRFKFQ